MVVSCEQVWREISNYLDGEVNPQVRAAMEAHFRECKHCTAVLDGTKNVVHLYADDRLVELPPGFSESWQRKLAESLPPPRGTAYGWLIAVAALALVSGSVALARFNSPASSVLRSELGESGIGVPPEMMVEVATDGKTFHAPGCKYLHEHDGAGNSARMVTAAEAIREGYVPCVRCLRRYLNRQAGLVLPRHYREDLQREIETTSPSGGVPPPEEHRGD